jgi:hypothetical protein
MGAGGEIGFVFHISVSGLYVWRLNGSINKKEFCHRVIQASTCTGIGLAGHEFQTFVAGSKTSAFDESAM